MLGNRFSLRHVKIFNFLAVMQVTRKRWQPADMVCNNIVDFMQGINLCLNYCQGHQVSFFNSLYNFHKDSVHWDHWGINLISKTPPNSFLHPPPPPPPAPIKVAFFSEPPKYSNFSSLIPSYLLKVTKFVVKISQFEFLVMTEKNIFVYKLFLSDSDFRF